MFNGFNLTLLIYCLTVSSQFILAADNKPQLRHIYFPVDQPGQFPAGDWKPIPYEELLSTLSTTEQTISDHAFISSLEVKLTRSSSEQFLGDVLLHVTNLAKNHQPLNCKTTNIIHELITTNEQVVLGNNLLGELIIIVPPGSSKIPGKIVLPARKIQPNTEINLTLPPCVNSKIEVVTEPDEVVHTNLSIAKVNVEKTSNKLKWTINAGARHELQLRISPRITNTPLDAKPFVFLDEQQTWNVSGSQTNLLVDIKPEIVGSVVDNIKFVVPEKLVIQNVSLLSGGSLSYRVEPEGSDTKLTVDLPDATPGAYPPIRLRFVLQTVLDKTWTLPEIKPISAAWLERKIALQIKSPLSLKQLKHPGFEQTGYTSETNTQDQFQFQWLYSKSNIDVVFTQPSLLPTSSTVHQLSYDQEIQKIQGYSLLTFKNVAEPFLEFKVPADFILYDIKANSLTEKNNQAVSWRKKSSNKEYEIYELQLLNPPDSGSKILVEWLVSATHNHNSGNLAVTMKLPGLFNTTSTSNHLVYKSPLPGSKVLDHHEVPLQEATMPYELWPAEFTKLVLPLKTDKSFNLPVTLDSSIQLKIIDKNIARQFLEQKCTITDRVTHSYQIPFDLFSNPNQLQIEALGVSHHLNWHVQLKDGATVRVHAEKEILHDRSVYTIPLIDELAEKATNLLLEIEHPLMNHFSTIQLIPRHLKSPLPLRLALSSEIEMNYQLDGPFKLLSVENPLNTSLDKIFELTDLSASWLITFHLKHAPQIVTPSLTELQIESLILEEKSPLLEHHLTYKFLPANKLVELLKQLPSAYKLRSVIINQDSLDDPKSLLDKITRYHLHEVFDECELVVQEPLAYYPERTWQIDIKHFMLNVNSWKIALSLPKSVTVEKITGSRSDSPTHTPSLIRFQHNNLPITSKTPHLPSPNLQKDSLFLNLVESVNYPYFQAYQTFSVEGQGSTFPNVIHVYQRPYNTILSSIIPIVLCLLIVGLYVKAKNSSWWMVLHYTYLILACVLWWFDASAWGIMFFTAGICGFLLPNLLSRFLQINTPENQPDSTSDLPIKDKSHSALVSSSVVVLLVITSQFLLPLTMYQIWGQEPALTTTQIATPVLADLLKFPAWDVIIPFTGNTPTPPSNKEIVYISANLHQAIKNQQKFASSYNQYLFVKSVYSCEQELDGSLRIAADLIVAAPASELELKIPLKPREITLAGINGCLIDQQTASISAQSDSSLILKIPDEVQNNKLLESKSISTQLTEESQTDGSLSLKKPEQKWVTYKVHLDFYPKPIVKSSLNSNYQIFVPPINNSIVQTNFKSRIHSGSLKTVSGVMKLASKSLTTYLLGNTSFIDIRLQQQPAPREFLDLELHMITLWDASPVNPKAQVFLEISGIDDNLKEFNLPIPQSIRLKNIYGNELESYQLLTGEKSGVTLKLKDDIKSTTYLLMEYEYLCPEFLDTANTILKLPPFKLPELDISVEQNLYSSSRLIGINPPRGYRLLENTPEQFGYVPVSRDMFYRASLEEFPLTALEETNLSRSRWETFITKPPEQLYRISKDEPFNVELVKLPLSINGSLDQSLVVNKNSLDYSAKLTLPARSTPYYHVELTLPGQVQIESAAIIQQSITKPLKWSHSDGTLNLFMEDRPGDDPLILLTGKQVISATGETPTSSKLVFQPALGTPLLVLESNQLNITNLAPGTWRVTASSGVSTNALPEETKLNNSLDLLSKPVHLVLDNLSDNSNASTTESPWISQEFKHQPEHKQTQCTWTHILQSLSSDHISGVSLINLNNEIPVVNLNINEKYSITAVAVNAKPLASYCQQDTHIRLSASNHSQQIQNITIHWELKIVPHKYFNWPEIFADSPQLISDTQRWIWDQQSLLELKPNRKIELVDQTKRKIWIEELNTHFTISDMYQPLARYQLSELSKESQHHQLVYLTSSEIKSCMWISNFPLSSPKDVWRFSYILLIPCISIFSVFLVRRLGSSFNPKHLVIILCSAVLMFPCFLAFPAEGICSLTMIIFSLLLNLIYLRPNPTPHQHIVVRLNGTPGNT